MSRIFLDLESGTKRCADNCERCILYTNMFDFLSGVYDWVRVVSAIVSVIFLALVIYYSIRTNALGGYKTYKLDIYKYGGEEKKRIPERWEKVLSLVGTKKNTDIQEALQVGDQLFWDVMKLDRVSKEDALGQEYHDMREKLFASVQAGEELDNVMVKELLRAYRHILRERGYLS